MKINKNATYTGYHVLFNVNGTDYDMKTRRGNRGTMTIFLISIDPETQTYNWKYTHRDDVFTSEYEYITKKSKIRLTDGIYHG